MGENFFSDSSLLFYRENINTKLKKLFERALLEALSEINKSENECESENYYMADIYDLQ